MSIGIAIYPGDGVTLSELLRNSDSAMYHAKENGRNTYSYFTETMNRDAERRIAIEEQMHGALDRGEFEVYYQPQIEISSERIVGVEALSVGVIRFWARFPPTSSYRFQSRADSL